ARRRRAVLRKRHRASPRRQLDGVGEEAFRCGAARHGGVLLHSDGTSPVTRYGWVLTLALALPPALEAQDIGLAVGTQAPAVTVWYAANGAAVRAYQAPTTSYIVVLDKAGKVRYTGAGAEQDVATALEQVVGN